MTADERAALNKIIAAVITIADHSWAAIGTANRDRIIVMMSEADRLLNASC